MVHIHCVGKRIFTGATVKRCVQDIRKQKVESGFAWLVRLVPPQRQGRTRGEVIRTQGKEYTEVSSPPPPTLTRAASFKSGQFSSKEESQAISSQIQSPSCDTHHHPLVGNP